MEQTAFALHVTYGKQRELVFISHLDVVRLFMRVFRKANLPLVYTQGFNVRPKVSFSRALPLGVSSTNETMIIHLRERRALDETKQLLNSLLPRGIQISSLRYAA